jgi:hypothetical protein
MRGIFYLCGVMSRHPKINSTRTQIILIRWNIIVYYLEDFYQKIKHNDIPDDIFFAVVTKSGTSYVMNLEDKASFIAFGDRYLSTEKKIRTLSLLYENTFSINNAGSAAINEKGFVKLLTKLGAGLNVYKGNDDFSKWSKLTYNQEGDNVTPSDCI